MSQKINDGGPAFPETGERGKAAGGEGMSIRDYFAAKAMQGLLANHQYFNDVGGTDGERTARLAYAHADAMLAARETAAKSDTDDGWIEWHGGECPVPGHVQVEVRFRDGTTARLSCAVLRVAAAIGKEMS